MLEAARFSLPDSRNTHDVLEVVYEPRVDAVAVWETVYRLLQRGGLAEELYTLDHDREVPCVEIGSAVRRSRRPGFHVGGQRCAIRLVRQGQYEIDVVYVSSFRNELRGHEDEWVLQLADNARGMISARVYDLDFDYWQSERRIQVFRNAGRPLGERRFAHDSVFDETVIDLSFNPGRTIWRRGYKEALGSIMWLTGEFCSRVSLDRSALMRMPNVVELRPSLWRLEFDREAFCCSGDRKLLDKLRLALFGNTGELAAERARG